MKKELLMSETVKLSLEFPKSFVEELWPDETQASVEMKEAFVLEFYRQRRISLRRAAELLSLSYREFMDLASRHEISLFEYEEGWPKRELEGLQSLRSKAV
jgi:predicted HTH domain antitoxin